MDSTRFDYNRFGKAKDMLEELLKLKEELGVAFDYAEVEVYAEEAGERIIDHVVMKSNSSGRTIVIEC